MGDVVKVGWADILRTDGVDAKGYGMIPKIPMLDPDLTLTAKAIYAFFCSLAGGGDTAFPGRDTTVSRLGLNKDTYYKHYKLLIEQGYISVKQEKAAGGKFSHNVYTLERNPKKLSASEEKEGTGYLYGTLSATGIKAKGYGSIPRMVMFDDRLSAKAKALYAYYASFSGAGRVAFPKVERTLKNLNLSRATYYKLMKELVSLNYISVVQRHVDGLLSVNDYFLQEYPDEEAVPEKPYASKAVISTKPPQEETPSLGRNQGANFSDTEQTIETQGFDQRTNFSDTERPLEPQAIHQRPKNQDTVNQDAVNQDTANQDTENSDTTNNRFSTKNSSLTKNNPQYNQASPSYRRPTAPAHWVDAMDRETLREYIKGNLGYDDFDITGAPPTVDAVNGLIELVLDTILLKTPTIRIAGGEASRKDVIDKLLGLRYEHYEYVLECVSNSPSVIRNIRAYYLTSLYSAPATMDAYYARMVQEDERRGTG